MKQFFFLLIIVFLLNHAHAQNISISDDGCDPVPWLNAEILENGNYEITWDYPNDTSNLVKYYLAGISYFDPCNIDLGGQLQTVGTFGPDRLFYTTSWISYVDIFTIQAQYDSCQSEWTNSNFVFIDSTWYDQPFDLSVFVSLADGNNPEGADVNIEGNNCYLETLSYNNQAGENGETLFDGVMHGTYEITVSKPGYHTAVIEDFYLEKDSTVNVELKVFYVGLEEKGESANISIYPNPATDQLTIESNSEIRKIELINLVGETVFEKNSIGLSETIQTSRFKPGIYFIRIKTEKGLVNRRVILSEK